LTSRAIPFGAGIGPTAIFREWRLSGARLRWSATLVDLPTDALVSETKSRAFEGLWLREPTQFLHDALPRARVFLGHFGDLRSRIDDVNAAIRFR
jgi:hypothetical protein